MLRPLEKISTATDRYILTPRDDALSHHVSTCGKSGSLDYSPLYVSEDGFQIMCPVQTYQVHGYRITAREETALHTVNASGRFALVLRVTSISGGDALYEIDQQTFDYVPSDDPIEKTEGVAEIILCLFEVAGGKITSITNSVKQLRSSEVSLGDKTTIYW